MRALAGHVADLADALSLERRVAHGQHLVHQQDLGLEVGGDREGQPQVHPGRVVLDRRIDEALDLGEGDDLVELRADLRPPHAEDGAVEVDVLGAGQLGMESGADLQQRADAAADLGGAGRGMADPGEQLEQRALAGAVGSDDAEDLASGHVEAHVPDGPDRVRLVAVTLGAGATRPDRPRHGPGQRVAQRGVALLARADAKPLAQALDTDRGVAHMFIGSSTAYHTDGPGQGPDWCPRSHYRLRACRRSGGA